MELGEVLWVDGEPRRKHKQVSTWPSLTVPRYSTNGNAMLELDKEMRARGYLLRIYDYKDCFQAGFTGVAIGTNWGECNSKADTIPEAVALAAYKALTGKGWGE